MERGTRDGLTGVAGGGGEPAPAEVMAGFPPDESRRVTKANQRQWPYLRWTLTHTRELNPTRAIWRGDRGSSPFNSAPAGLNDLPVDLPEGGTTTLVELLERLQADAFAVVHRGRLVYERYWHDYEPRRPHYFASMTKSFTGTLALLFAQRGEIDLAARADRYLPELAPTGLGSATLRQLLDMQAGVYFVDGPYAPDAPRYFGIGRAIGSQERPPDYNGPRTIYDYLLTATRDREHGREFDYLNGCTESLAWILRRVSGLSLADLIGQTFWQPIRAEEDADIVVDAVGAEQASGGMSGTLRDLARFGDMLRSDGAAGGAQVLPAELVARISAGGDRELFGRGDRGIFFPGFSYASQWWVCHDEYGGFMANGLFGQHLYVAPRAETVIAQFSSYPASTNPVARTRHALYRAICRHLN